VGIRVIVLAALLASCGHAPPTTTPAAGAPEQPPIPEHLRPSVERAIRVGREILAQDEVTARAMDLFLARVPEPDRSGYRGWITIPGPWWKVAYVFESDGKPQVRFEAAFPREERLESARPGFQRIEPPRPLDDEERARFQALQTVLKSRPARCGPTNPVVLPATLADEKGWLVYLLYATTEVKVRISGGHTRFRVSEDGTRVVESTTLSQCLAGQPATNAGEQLVELVVGTPLFDAPNEGHVFTAMSNRLPLHLLTYKTPSGRAWVIREDGTVTFDRQLPPRP
jgi:hypothetical protein